MDVVDNNLETYCVGYAVIDKKYCHNAIRFIDVYFHVYNITHSLHVLVILIPFERYRLGTKQTTYFP